MGISVTTAWFAALAALVFVAPACGEPEADAALCGQAADRAEALEIARAVAQALEESPEDRWPILAAEMRSALLADPAVAASIAEQRAAFLAACEGRPAADIRCVIDAPGYDAYLACLAAEQPAPR